MKKITTPLLILLMTGGFLLGCSNQNATTETSLPTPNWPPSSANESTWDKTITKEVYYDKVLGALVGSAIGDAMGAPTEMWHRSNINTQYGFVDSLDVLVREGSPEGPWEDNLPAGGTTDDTRWKYLVGKFLLSQGRKDSLNAKDFANYLVKTYLTDMAQVKKTDAFDPEPIEKNIRKMAWLQEWAKVAKPYAENDMDKYSFAVSKFYGGEMVCAGMLYAPILGAYYPANPDRAYREAYRLGFFDIGYARDITGLTAALVSKAMKPNVRYEEIALVNRDIDPYRYFNSRLVGRAAYRVYQDAKTIVFMANQLQTKDVDPNRGIFQNFKHDALYFARMQKAFELLEKKSQDMPFHAAEIQLINLTALEFSGGDFRKAMEFVVNYGRDNDTVGAVTGAILGAYWGYQKLPKDLVQKSLSVNKKVVGLDLEQLAKDITEMRFKE